mgnify:CR=1 FL=1
MWFIFALLSAVFAALTSILAKIGIAGVSSNLATAIRTIVVLVMAWGIVLLTGEIGGVRNISGRSWLFLGLSGVATGLSWLCYYHALQLGGGHHLHRAFHHGRPGRAHPLRPEAGDLPGAGIFDLA